MKTLALIFMSVLPLLFATNATSDDSVNLNPDSFDGNPAGQIFFGNVNLGATSQQTLILSHRYNGPLTIGPIAGFVGPFSTKDECSGSLPPASPCSITLMFTPMTAQRFSADLEIPYTEPSGVQRSMIIALQGDGANATGADISVNHDFIDLGFVRSDTNPPESSRAELLIRNDGDIDLIISSLTVTGQDIDKFTQTNDCSAVISSGTCSVTVEFMTGSEGYRHAGLYIESNDPDESPYTVWMHGYGTASHPPSDMVIGGSPCFIATAAYGSSLDPHVETLRSFKNTYLLTNALGRWIVRIYYRHSPPIADFLQRHEMLKAATRWILTPIVFCIEYPPTLLLVVLPGFLFLWFFKKGVWHSFRRVDH